MVTCSDCRNHESSVQVHEITPQECDNTERCNLHEVTNILYAKSEKYLSEKEISVNISMFL